jgi:surface protein
MEILNGVEFTDGMIITTYNYTPPTPSSLMIEFNSQPAWSDQVSLFLYESSLAGPTIPVDVTIDWGDGNTEYAGSGNTYPHTYATSGTYNIQVSGNALGYFGVGYNGVIGISSWGNLQIEDLGYAVEQCSNLVYVPNNIPSSVLGLYGTFSNCAIFNDSNVSLWNTSNVTDMGAMFLSASNFNQDISSWDVSNVTYMSFMFYGADAFNQDIGNWNVSNVTYMDSMFENATSFNQNLSQWCPINILSEPAGFDTNTPAWVKTGRQPLWGTCSTALQLQINATIGSGMEFAFYGNTNVNINWGDGSNNLVTGNNPSGTYSPYKTYSTAGTYNIAITGQANGFSVTENLPLTKVISWGNLTGFDSLALAFNGAPNLTNVPDYLPANVSNLYRTFIQCDNFNDSNVSLWDTSNVVNMLDMFNSATVFNQNLDSWNTSNVTNMAGMFGGATAFNGNIGNWNTGNVTDMGFMFDEATSFNKPIGNWNVSNVNDMGWMFNYATSFNQDLSSWCVTNILSEPIDFDTNTPAWVKTGRQPVWGTCPP